MERKKKKLKTFSIDEREKGGPLLIFDPHLEESSNYPQSRINHSSYTTAPYSFKEGREFGFRSQVFYTYPSSLHVLITLLPVLSGDETFQANRPKKY